MSETAERTHWTYDDYRDLPDDGKRYEIIRGKLIVSPAPRSKHQYVVNALTFHLHAFVRERNLGLVFGPAPDVVLAKDSVVQPDILFVSNERKHVFRRGVVKGAPDFVVEVLSESTRGRDTNAKRGLYAEHGVREYWLVDPVAERIEIYALEGTSLVKKAEITEGHAASLSALPGFTVPLMDLFAFEEAEKDDASECREGDEPYSLAEFPPKGPCNWRDYWRQPDDGKRWEILRGEFVLLPTPTVKHQIVMGNLLHAIMNHVEGDGERLGFCVMRLATVLADDTVVDPDILFVARARQKIVKEPGVFGAPDLLVEIVFEKTRERDTEIKRRLYGECGVREYWIVDPDAQSVEVLALEAGRLVTKSTTTNGDVTSAVALPGLRVPICAIFE
ncbi:MAG: Uma2 family endonuclease [Planctomycetes bacterium]|nr:Uma2 family endonuclease [Planctomycetota bacterium]